ncbi:MAG: hypothetical protein WBD40_01355 [Tepidisphaeraceae bacterium]
MSAIEQKVRSITEDRRGDWLFDTKLASDAVGCHPRKFGDWWGRTTSKLIELYIAQPGQLAAELAVLIARAEAERQRRDAAKPTPPLRAINH